MQIFNTYTFFYEICTSMVTIVLMNLKPQFKSSQRIFPVKKKHSFLKATQINRIRKKFQSDPAYFPKISGFITIGFLSIIGQVRPKHFLDSASLSGFQKAMLCFD